MQMFNTGGLPGATQPLKLPTPPPPPPPPKPLVGVQGVANAQAGADQIMVKPGTASLSDVMAPDPLFSGAPDSVFTGSGSQSQAFDQGCVAAMFAKEWETQRPEQYTEARTALAVPGGQMPLPGGKTLAVPDMARAQIDADPTLTEGQREDAYVQAALMAEGDFASRFDDSQGLSEPGVKVLNDALDLGISLNESGAPRVGDYVAITQGDSRHFMKVIGDEHGQLRLQDGYGNTAEATNEQLAVDIAGASASAGIGIITGGAATASVPPPRTIPGATATQSSAGPRRT